ncbi:MAG TPA: hypothetical protein VHT97_03870 [Acidimicrobiales bacterium]|jgi:hypothetical protein|nr:hypothetical protein [Acidimicrobiales bacterium]
MGPDWSPDEPLETETFEAWDEAADDEEGSSPGQLDGSMAETSLDEQLLLDETEVNEVGVNLDDPERMAVLDGGADDPDGVGIDVPPGEPRVGEEGWDLDAGEQRTADSLDELQE